MARARVINRSDAAHADSWQGETIVFEPGKPVSIPLEAAMAFFGHGLRDREPVIARLGWAKTRNDLAAALARLEAFEIVETDDEPSEQAIPRLTLASATRGADRVPRAARR